MAGAGQMPASLAGYPTGPQSAVNSRGLPAFALSFLLHLSLLTALLLLLAQFPRGASEVENRAGGIVLVNQQADSTEYLSEGDVLEASSPEQTMAAATESTAPELELPPDLPGLESGTSLNDGVAEEVAQSLTGADKMITTPKEPGLVGGRVTTEVFGVTGTGSRFVYVFDRSQSMAGGGNNSPMLAARQALIKSLQSLPQTSQFQIIFYNGDTRIFNPDGRAGVYFAEEQFKRKAIEFIRSVKPDGGTDHLNALKAAFKLAPDVIFLLTDAEGGFTNDELRQVVRYNRSAAVINTIEFGQRQGSDRSLEQISRTSGGQYLFKNVRSLRVEQ